MRKVVVDMLFIVVYFGKVGRVEGIRRRLGFSASLFLILVFIS